MGQKFKKNYQAANTFPDRVAISMVNGDKNNGVLGIKDIIDKTTQVLFASYKTILLSEPITYIVSAVWGKDDQGNLTSDQREINENISVIINDIIEILEIDEITDAQEFAIEYLIRGLIISKVTYLIEAFRNSRQTGNESNQRLMDLLNSLEVAGNA